MPRQPVPLLFDMLVNEWKRFAGTLECVYLYPGRSGKNRRYHQNFTMPLVSQTSQDTSPWLGFRKLFVPAPSSDARNP